MVTKNIPDARNRILKAAVKIFTQKSFEGSRIDEIAAEAGVPKSLIYYHFKSKNEILEVLISGFLTEYTGLLRSEGEDPTHRTATGMESRLKNMYADFAFKNADLIRIILVESLKVSDERPVIYKLLEAFMDADEKSAAGKTSNYDRSERMIAEFFTGMMPLFAFLCFSPSWVRCFGVDQEEFDNKAIQYITEAHGAYHQIHDKTVKG